MTIINKLTPQKIHSASLGKRALQGSVIALTLISIFLVGAKSDPTWSKYWMVKPLLIVPIAGGMGGVFYYFMDYLSCLGGWKTVLAYVVSLFGFMVAVWLGTVLGLNGTLWN